MRATFTDASTLGIVMGDMNLSSECIDRVKQYGSIGKVQNCDHHPKEEYLLSCFDAGKTPTLKSDYIFAGNATTTPIKFPTRLGLDGDHAAILAKVTFDGPPDAPDLSPDVEPQDVNAAERILENLVAKAESWVPDEPHPHDAQMAELARRQVQERIFIGVMHLMDGLADVITRDQVVARFGNDDCDSAKAFRQKLWSSSASTPAFGQASSSASTRAAQELEMLSRYHLAQRGEVQKQQAEAADIAALDAAKQKQAEALQQAEEKAHVDAVLRRQQELQDAAKEREAQQKAGFEAQEALRRQVEEKAQADKEREAQQKAAFEAQEELRRQAAEKAHADAVLRRQQELQDRAAKEREAQQTAGFEAQEALRRQVEEQAQADKEREAQQKAAFEAQEELRRHEDAKMKLAAELREAAARRKEEEARQQKLREAREHAQKSVEDSKSSAPRRLKELEDDKEQARHLRRQGLPSRVLVDRDGSAHHARPGGVDMAIAQVASALAARRKVLSAAEARSGASTPAAEDVEFIHVRDTTVIARHLQDEVMARIDAVWRQTEEGQKYVQMAKDKVHRQTAEKHKRWKDQGWQAAGASTPGEEGTEFQNQVDGAMKSYFKTHCDQVYGGIIWVKFLITLGDIPQHAIDALNDLYMARAMEKRGQPPNEFATPTPAGDYLRRADRASTPVPPDYVKPKKLRQKAKDRLDTLVDMMEQGTWVEPETIRAAEQMMHEAEEVSRRSLHEFKSYWGAVQNAFESTQASAFEMVLENTLRKHYDFDKQQVDTIMRDRKWEGKGEGKGGKGKGYGRGGKAARRGP